MTREEAVARIKDHIEIHRYHERNAVKIFEALDMAIKALEQPEQQWIPCSERLPMDRDWYLGIFKEPDTGWVNPIPYVCDYASAITTATTYEGWILHHCTDQDMPCEYYKELQCVAWMPLPEPYKEGREE